MAEITLPDLSLIWASAGDVLKPSDAKIQQGWSAEVPPRQWFNWLDRRQDEAIAHIAQHGIAAWSDTLEYQAGKSYVQGSDGIVYKALTTNTNINPVGNIGDWEQAWLDANSSIGPSVATAAQARALTDNTVFISPLQLANAFTGSNQFLGSNGFQKLPGGIIEQWGQATGSSGGYVTLTFPTAWPNGLRSIVGTVIGTANTNLTVIFNPSTLTATTISFAVINSSNTFAVNSIYWRAIGS